MIPQQMRRLGQHFLRNRTIVRRIVEALSVGKGEAVIEIGPGHGELTSSLLDAVRSSRGRVLAIEKDERLAAALIERAASDLQGLEVITGDALKILPKIASDLALKGTVYKVAGNLPYYITGKLLRTLGDLPYKPESMVFMLQNEVAERIQALPPHMNRLAASIQYWAEPKFVAFVPKKDFSPPPEVDSAVILLQALKEKELIAADRYYEALRALFAQPRKTILNNISSARAPKLSKNDVSERLVALALSPEVRPQDLSTKDIVRIAEALF